MSHLLSIWTTAPVNSQSLPLSSKRVRSRRWSWSYFTTDGRSVSTSWCRAPLWGPWPDFTFSFLLKKNCFALRFGKPSLTRGRSIICSAICQWSESRRTRNHTLLSHLRLSGSLSVASYDSQGLRWKYSYPPPHGDRNRRLPRQHFISVRFPQLILDY
jgi:hypothetical protein